MKMNKALLKAALYSFKHHKLNICNLELISILHGTQDIRSGSLRPVEEFLQEPGYALWRCTLGIFFLHPASD